MLQISSALKGARFMKKCLAITILACLLSGCMLINPVKRMPLEEVGFNKPMPRIEKKVVVLLEEAVAGKPLSETVWDNFSGPFWDPEESQQIGVTVFYRFAPVVIPGGATAATTAEGARWVVPFGPLLSDTMKSAMEQHFLSNIECYSDDCVQQAISSGQVDTLLRIKSSFKVWTPSPTSLRLSYSSDVAFATYSSPLFTRARSGISNITRTDMKLNSIISYMAISEMRDYSKEFIEEVVGDVLTRAFAEK
jgi:hypothetical protein